MDDFVLSNDHRLRHSYSPNCGHVCQKIVGKINIHELKIKCIFECLKIDSFLPKSNNKIEPVCIPAIILTIFLFIYFTRTGDFSVLVYKCHHIFFVLLLK